jgi:putative cell wall-binding protein
LLVTADAVPVATAEEIRRRQPRQPVIVGGASAVSSAVADELRALAR